MKNNKKVGEDDIEQEKLFHLTYCVINPLVYLGIPSKSLCLGTWKQFLWFMFHLLPVRLFSVSLSLPSQPSSFAKSFFLGNNLAVAAVFGCAYGWKGVEDCFNTASWIFMKGESWSRHKAKEFDDGSWHLQNARHIKENQTWKANTSFVCLHNFAALLTFDKSNDEIKGDGPNTRCLRHVFCEQIDVPENRSNINDPWYFIDFKRHSSFLVVYSLLSWSAQRSSSSPSLFDYIKASDG